MDIAKFFNKFSGKEIKLEKACDPLHFGGHSYDLGGVNPSEKDPVLKALRRAAQNKGLVLRLLFSEGVRSCDYREDRVNVRIDKAAGGKYRIAGISIG